MRLEKITENNLLIAVDVAHKIFPYEIHKDGFWTEITYQWSIEEKKDNFAYYLVYEDEVLLTARTKAPTSSVSG